jgi:hypothetical protein
MREDARHSTMPSMTSRLRSRRSLPPIALAGAWLAVAAPPAAAAVAFSASVAPARVSSPAALEYALTMVNDGAAEERFSVALVAPTYHPARAGDAIAESNSVRQAGDPRIEGSARFLGGFTRVAGLIPACSSTGAGGHGYGIDGVSFDVGLPARSTSILRASYEAGLPFWPDLDLRLRFVLRPRLTTGQAGTLARELKVLTPQPAISGRVAVHMTLRTTPASGLGGFAAHPAIARGKAVAIGGTAKPAIAGQRIELRWARIASSSGRIVARGSAGRPKVTSSGTFRARWTPPQAGDYELWARYVSQRSDLRSDDTCPRKLRVRRR